MKVKNGDRWMTVNALLDDASTKIYINADVAAELGLKGKTGRKGNYHEGCDKTVSFGTGKLDAFS